MCRHSGRQCVDFIIAFLLWCHVLRVSSLLLHGFFYAPVNCSVLLAVGSFFSSRAWCVIASVAYATLVIEKAIPVFYQQQSFLGLNNLLFGVLTQMALIIYRICVVSFNFFSKRTCSQPSCAIDMELYFMITSEVKFLCHLFIYKSLLNLVMNFYCRLNKCHLEVDLVVVYPFVSKTKC